MFSAFIGEIKMYYSKIDKIKSIEVDDWGLKLSNALKLILMVNSTLKKKLLWLLQYGKLTNINYVKKIWEQQEHSASDAEKQIVGI